MTETVASRRLTTILAGDFVGYSRLMAEDEEGTLRTLKSHRALIGDLLGRHQGRLFNTAGDAVLAEFGSAVEAVRCAIAIQEELAVRNDQLPAERRMLMRIGVNVGDVMVEGDDLFGDGVNVAARLESIADPGSVFISGSTFEHVKNKLSIAFKDRGPQSVKNIPQPVSVFQIAAASAPSVEVGAARNPPWRLTAAISAAVIAVAVAAYFVVPMLGSGDAPAAPTGDRVESGSPAPRAAAPSPPWRRPDDNPAARLASPSTRLSGEEIASLMTGKTIWFQRAILNMRGSPGKVTYRLTMEEGGRMAIHCRFSPDRNPDVRVVCRRPPPAGSWKLEGSLLCWTILRNVCFRVEKATKTYQLRQVPLGPAMATGPFTVEE